MGRLGKYACMSTHLNQPQLVFSKDVCHHYEQQIEEMVAYNFLTFFLRHDVAYCITDNRSLIYILCFLLFRIKKIIGLQNLPDISKKLNVSPQKKCFT